MIKTFTLSIIIIGAHSNELKEAECRSMIDKYDYQSAASRNFLSGETWPNNEIPYEIASGFSYSDRKVIKSAMQHIQRRVCIKWTRRSKEFNYVSINHDRRGCFASLGYDPKRGRHSLNLQRGDGRKTCLMMGIVAHEMLHIMGFAHEPARPDRDDYVRVNWRLIQPYAIRSFFRSISIESSSMPPPICDPRSHQKRFDNCYSGYTVDTFGFSYDYGSIMHYTLNSFSSTGEDTLTVLAPVPIGAVIGNRKAMTKLDTMKAQAKYGCNEKTTDPPSVGCRDKYDICPSIDGLCKTTMEVRVGCPYTCGFC